MVCEDCGKSPAATVRRSRESGREGAGQGFAVMRPEPGVFSDRRGNIGTNWSGLSRRSVAEEDAGVGRRRRLLRFHGRRVGLERSPGSVPELVVRDPPHLGLSERLQQFNPAGATLKRRGIGVPLERFVVIDQSGLPALVGVRRSVGLIRTAPVRPGECRWSCVRRGSGLSWGYSSMKSHQRTEEPALTGHILQGLFSQASRPGIWHPKPRLGGQSSGRRPSYALTGLWIILLFRARPPVSSCLRTRGEVGLLPTISCIILAVPLHAGEQRDVSEEFEALSAQCRVAIAYCRPRISS